MGINGDGYHEYGVNISRRWHLNEMHTPPCCTGNQARLLPNYIHHSALQSPLTLTLFPCAEITTPSACHCIAWLAHRTACSPTDAACCATCCT